MKGAIFTGFAEFVEDKFDLTTWLQTIDNCTLPSNAEYLATEVYDDEEFFIIANQLCEETGQTADNLFREFGHYFFPTLMSIAKKHIEQIDNLFEFLVAVDTVIHIEVKKADPLAYTPSLYYDTPAKNVLVMRYVSKRKMCFFAEGLILGAADYFNERVSISQSACLCKGDDHCLIRIET